MLPAGGSGGTDGGTDGGRPDARGPPPAAAALGPAARGMPAFPIVGMIIGLAAGSAGAGLLWAGADPLIGAFAAVAATAVLTGLHHADGLADTADGLMASGSRRRRLEAMRDRSTGAAGAAALALSYVGTVAGLSLAGGAYELLIAVVLSEAAAKFAMVLMARVGSPAAQGSGAVFAAACRGPGGRWRLPAAAGAAALPAAALGGYAGGAMLAAAAAAAIVLACVASRRLGGITGDVLGACNELARLASVLVLVSVW